MDNLIDIIVENPFILIVIIGGLISLFKGKGKQEEQQKKQQEQQQKQSQQPQQARRTPPAASRSPQQQKSDHRPTHVERETISNLSVEEHRAQQMKRFTDSFSANQHSGMTDRSKVADARRAEEVQKLTSKYNQKKFKDQFENSLTRKGLVNSVIMAEVLGSSRARNPYQSVIAKRKSL